MVLSHTAGCSGRERHRAVVTAAEHKRAVLGKAHRRHGTAVPSDGAVRVDHAVLIEVLRLVILVHIAAAGVLPVVFAQGENLRMRVREAERWCAPTGGSVWGDGVPNMSESNNPSPHGARIQKNQERNQKDRNVSVGSRYPVGSRYLHARPNPGQRALSPNLASDHLQGEPARKCPDKRPTASTSATHPHTAAHLLSGLGVPDLHEPVV